MKNKNVPLVISNKKLVLQLYVSGMSPKSMEAIENINKICSAFLEDTFQLEIIDLYKHPEVASEQQIVFSPLSYKTTTASEENTCRHFFGYRKSDQGPGHYD